jgi:hypothetical protein
MGMKEAAVQVDLYGGVTHGFLRLSPLQGVAQRCVRSLKSHNYLSPFTAMSHREAHLRGIRVDTELARREIDRIAHVVPLHPRRIPRLRQNPLAPIKRSRW